MLWVPLLVMPLIDQGIKYWLRRRLGSRSVPLGAMVTVRMVSARVWLARSDGTSNLALIWVIWVMAGSALAILAAMVPSSRVFAGLLLGGSLSHALETSWRGKVSDYICSRWWPAFNLADVSITVGALGVVIAASMALARA